MKTACWIPLLAALAIIGGATAGADATAPGPAPGVFESGAAPAPVAPIDRLVAANLARLGIAPVLCSDGVFVRRVFLDLLGTLPSAQEARDFILDPDLANKRRKLIDRLLERDEFADFWALRWGDVLRIKAEFPVNLWPNAAQAYHRWLRAAIAANMPYDQFARDLLTSSGSNFRVGPVNFYRALQNRQPDGIAAAVALTFMGTRTDTWPAPRLAGMAAFFSQLGYKPTNEWKEEHVFWDPLGSATTPGNSAPGQPAITPANPPAASTPAVAAPSRPLAATFPDGRHIDLPADRDPREIFAEWLTRRHPARQPAEQPGLAGLSRTATRRQPLRCETPLPAHPEFPGLSIFPTRACPHTRGGRQFR